MPSISTDVPARYVGRTLAGYEPGGPSTHEALAAAHALRDAAMARLTDPEATPGRPTNVVLVGPPGVGKTHLAAAVFQDVVRARQASIADARSRFHDAEIAYREALADRENGDGGALPDQPRHPRAPAFPTWVNVPAALVDLRREFGTEEHPVADEMAALRHRKALVVLDDLGREKASDWTAEVLYVLVNDRYESSLPTIVTTNLGRDELVSSGYWPVISRLAEDGVLVEVKAPDHRLVRRVS